MSVPVEVVSWDDGVADTNTISYDSDLLGSTANIETEEAICARVVPELCARSDVAGLRQLTTVLSEIPERFLADMLLTTLGSTSPVREEALDDMLRVPYTPAVMTSELRRRHLSDVTRLAGYVTKRLQTTEAAMEPVLLEWLTVVVDSQSTSWALSDGEEAWELLHAIGEWRNKQEVQARDLLCLQREMDQLAALRKDPPSPPAADYAVETLYL
ncbi:hypothetical protein FJT64_005802 [Amphibalanus amphitrite]|uniref:Uncharacterized protein n=1 Tax=Amphibalanus amphitrite TaxID=1232801 RepID=A0A6A4VK80_AMPAM|nr:hypothetical protein FJT64_005802 [Amphibalanus amphitrite]KAF0296787.1 hypothetical protein FJT64_005802 [Amphibalanus amphitrite]